MKLFFDQDGWSLEGDEAFLNWLDAEFRLEQEDGDVHIILVDNETIEEMNESYLGHEGPTDVISFRLVDEEEEGGGEEFITPGDEDEAESEEFPFPVGEVYVSLQMAGIQARDYDVSLTDEVSRLALHGVLHVAGWLDDSDEQRAAMARREDEGLNRARGEGGNLPWNLHGPAAMEG